MNVGEAQVLEKSFNIRKCGFCILFIIPINNPRVAFNLQGFNCKMYAITEMSKICFQEV